MKAYKVTDLWNNSYIATGTFRCSYAIGQVTTPPDEFPEAYLMAFQYIEYAKLLCGGKIYLAEVELADSQQWVRVSALTEDMGKFWRGENVPTMSVPLGTIFCKSIKLLKDVTYEDI